MLSRLLTVPIYIYLYAESAVYSYFYFYPESAGYSFYHSESADKEWSYQ